MHNFILVSNRCCKYGRCARLELLLHTGQGSLYIEQHVNPEMAVRRSSIEREACRSRAQHRVPVPAADEWSTDRHGRRQTSDRTALCRRTVKRVAAHLPPNGTVCVASGRTRAHTWSPRRRIATGARRGAPIGEKSHGAERPPAVSMTIAEGRTTAGLRNGAAAV